MAENDIGGRIFDLEQPRTAQMPVHPGHRQGGYSYLLHRHHEDEYRPGESGPRTSAAGVIICGEHTGTHRKIGKGPWLESNRELPNSPMYLVSFPG